MSHTSTHREAIKRHYNAKVLNPDDLNTRIAGNPNIVHHHEGAATAYELATARAHPDDNAWLDRLVYRLENDITLRLASSLAIRNAAHILDAGCGRGGSAIMLGHLYGSNITGLSLSDEQVAFAQRAAINEGLEDKLRFEVGDMTATRLSDGSVDYVWALGSTEHVLDLSVMSKEFYRVTAPLGRLMIYACTKSSAPELQTEAARYAEKADNWYSTRLHTLTEYKNSLQEAGWAIAIEHDFTEEAANYWEIRSLIGRNAGSEQFMTAGLRSEALNYHMVIADKM